MNSLNSSQNAAMARLAVSVGICVAIIAIMASGKIQGIADGEAAKRSVATALGLMLLAIGNCVPKLRLFQSRNSTTSSAVSVDRFAGWVLVFGGAGFALIWLLTPLEDAVIAGPFIGILSFLIVFARWLYWRQGQNHAALPSPTLSRLIVAIILISIFWTFGIFFVDAVWGDVAARWAAIIFVFSLSGLVPFIMLLRNWQRDSE